MPIMRTRTSDAVLERPGLERSPRAKPVLWQKRCGQIAVVGAYFYTSTRQDSLTPALPPS